MSDTPRTDAAFNSYEHGLAEYGFAKRLLECSRQLEIELLLAREEIRQFKAREIDVTMQEIGHMLGAKDQEDILDAVERKVQVCEILQKRIENAELCLLNCVLEYECDAATGALYTREMEGSPAINVARIYLNRKPGQGTTQPKYPLSDEEITRWLNAPPDNVP